MVLFRQLLGRFRRAIAAGLGIAAYALLVGAEPAVVRAAIMGGLSLFARQVGWRQAGLNSLAGVAAAMALFNPQILADASYQLSFGATLGLVLYAEPLSRGFVTWAGRRLPPDQVQRLAGPVGKYLLFTLAAQLTTLPVMALQYRRLSLVSLVANPAILPAQPAVMVLGGLGFVLYYAVLFAWTFAGARARQAVDAIGPGLSLAAAGLLTGLVWQEALAAPDGRLHLAVLDTNDGVYFGTALLIQSPTGRYLLINGGPSSRKLSDSLGRRMPFSHRQLDYLVVANPPDRYAPARWCLLPG